MRIEIYMEPFATSLFRTHDRFLNQGFRDALALKCGRHHSVQNESVDTAIPCDVHEPDQFFGSTGADPTKAVLVDL